MADEQGSKDRLVPVYEQNFRLEICLLPIRRKAWRKNIMSNGSTVELKDACLERILGRCISINIL